MKQGVKFVVFSLQILNLYYSCIGSPSMKLPLHTVTKTCMQYVQLLRFVFHGDGSECWSFFLILELYWRGLRCQAYREASGTNHEDGGCMFISNFGTLQHSSSTHKWIQDIFYL